MRHHWIISLSAFIALMIGARTGHALLDPQAAFYLNLALLLGVAILGVILVFVAASYLTVLFCGWGLRHQLERSYTLLWGWNMLRSQRDVVPTSYRFNRWLDKMLPSNQLVLKGFGMLLLGGALLYGGFLVYTTHTGQTRMEVAEMEALVIALATLGVVFVGLGCLSLIRRISDVPKWFTMGMPPRHQMLTKANTSLALGFFLSVVGLALLLGILPFFFWGAEHMATQIAAGLLLLSGVLSLLQALRCLFVGLFFQHRQTQDVPPLQTRVAVTLPNFISMVGVGVGVWAIIVVMGVMSGFQGVLRDKIVSTKPHVLVQPTAGRGVIADPQQTMDKLKGIDGIRSMDAYVEENVMVRSALNSSVNLTLLGIDPGGSRAKQLEGTLVTGSTAILANPETMISPAARLIAPRPKPAETLKKIPVDTTAGKISMPPIPGGKPLGTTPDLAEEKQVFGLWICLDVALQLELRQGDTLSLRPPGTTAELQTEVMGVFESPDRPGARTDAYFLIPAQAEVDGEDVMLAAVSLQDSNRWKPWMTKGTKGQQVPLLVAPFSDNDPTLNDILISGLLDGEVYPGIILGSVLAQLLHVDVGSSLSVISLDAGVGPLGVRPKEEPFRVAGIFQSGMYEFDLTLAYMSRNDAQQFFDIGNTVNRIALELENPSEPDTVVAAVTPHIPSGTEVRDWQQLNQSLFSALKLEKIGMFIVLGFIILVASFNILASLAMQIQEKSGEIAILKSMGATDSGIMRAFTILGLFLGLVGAFCGSLIGLVICVGIERWGLPLPPEYYIPTLPVEINGVEVVAAVVVAISISLLATILPSLSASRLDPVEGLRYE